MTQRRKLWERRPSPALVIALIALFAALAGTASALRGKNTVRSDDIAPGQVKRTDLGAQAADPFKLSLTKLRTGPPTVTTASPTPVDLGGPTVTVKVPKGGLVAVHVQATMSITGGGQQNQAELSLVGTGPSGLAAPQTILTTGSATPGTRYTVPGSPDGVSSVARGGWLVFSPGAGDKAFSIRYSKTGAGTAIFSNPKLWVTVIG